MEKGNLEKQRGEKRTVDVSVKAESPDDQRALKEDWVASALLVLRSIRGTMEVSVCGKKELTQRTCPCYC